VTADDPCDQWGGREIPCGHHAHELGWLWQLGDCGPAVAVRAHAAEPQIDTAPRP